MTEQEKRQLKAMLLLERQEAQDNFAHLREKASHMRESFGEVAEWLNAASLSSPRFHKTDLVRKIRDDADSYRKSLEFDAMVSLMHEIEIAEKLVADLASRKLALGLR